MHLYYEDTPIHIDNASLVMCDVEYLLDIIIRTYLRSMT